MRKIFTVIGVILLVAGIALGAIAFASVGFNPQKLGGQSDFEQKQFVVGADTVKALEIADENNSITLARSSDQSIVITYYESQKDRYDLGVDDGGLLTMRYVNDRQWYERIGIQWGHPDTHVTVALPASFRGDLALGTVNGSITAQEQPVGALRAATTNGDIRLNNVGATGDAVVSTVNGQILLGGLTANSITASGVNGQIQVGGISATGAISLSTTNGSISGAIQGNAQDYTVNAGTVNGSCNLTNSTGGAKSLSVHTTNGSIDVRFLS